MGKTTSVRRGADFRRIFATEAVTGGLSVHIAAKILGPDHLGTTQHYLAVFQEDLIRAYQGFLRARRAARPPEEYREPTDEEWAEFQQHFLLRRVELGNCGRPYAAPCHHEFACIRCPMLQVDPRQRLRQVEIVDILRAQRRRPEAGLARRSPRARHQLGGRRSEARLTRPARSYRPRFPVHATPGLTDRPLVLVESRIQVSPAVVPQSPVVTFRTS
ncbi:hypothetical protein ABZW49_42845 [Nonomuraea wenchangensis]